MAIQSAGKLSEAGGGDVHVWGSDPAPRRSGSRSCTSLSYDICTKTRLVRRVGTSSP
jgi:hypothetical protein